MNEWKRILVTTYDDFIGQYGTVRYDYKSSIGEDMCFIDLDNGSSIGMFMSEFEFVGDVN